MRQAGRRFAALHDSRICRNSAECGALFDAGSVANVRTGQAALAWGAVVRDSVEFLPHAGAARRFSRWVPRLLDCANGSEDGALEICEAGTTFGGGEKEELTGKMIPLLVDLEREWRGGQSQFLL